MPTGALADGMLSHRDKPIRPRNASVRTDAKTVALAASPEETPPPPIEDRDAEVIGFPKGIHFATELNSAFQYGTTGELRNTLPGGINAVATFRVEPRTNIFVNYYQLQVQPLGVDTGFAPVFNAGDPTQRGNLPIGLVRDGGATKVYAFAVGFQRILFIGAGAANHGHPIIIAPSYSFLRADIAGGFQNMQEQFNNGEAMRVYQGVNQQYSLNVAIPLSLTEKLVVAYFGSPTILVHPNGFNLTNHVQYRQQVVVLYNPNKQTQFFFEPSRAFTYVSSDSYPINSFNLVYGVQHKLYKPRKSALVPFVKAEVITSNPDNPPGGIGVTRLVNVPGIGLLGTIGGVKFTTIRVAFGIGNTAGPIIQPYP